MGDGNTIQSATETPELDDNGVAQTENQNDEIITTEDSVGTSSSNDDDVDEHGQKSIDTLSSNDGNDGQSTLDEDDEAIVETIVKKVVERLSASGMLNSEH